MWIRTDQSHHLGYYPKVSQHNRRKEAEERLNRRVSEHVAEAGKVILDVGFSAIATVFISGINSQSQLVKYLDSKEAKGPIDPALLAAVSLVPLLGMVAASVVASPTKGILRNLRSIPEKLRFVSSLVLSGLFIGASIALNYAKQGSVHGINVKDVSWVASCLGNIVLYGTLGTGVARTIAPYCISRVFQESYVEYNVYQLS